MDIIIKKITDLELLQEAAGMTTGNTSKMSLHTAYKSEHSPVRTQMFFIQMLGIPTASSVHLVRHKTWIEHFVKSNRPDRGGDKNAGRATPVNHGIFVNAQELIEMSKVRLCNKADKTTRKIMEAIVKGMRAVDSDLANYMVPKCAYRNCLCGEPKTCGKKEAMLKKYHHYFELFT